MTIERAIRILAGTFTLVSLALGAPGSPLHHDPRWLWRRFEGYRCRRGVELRDERRAFAGLARKCQRDRAGGTPWA